MSDANCDLCGKYSDIQGTYVEAKLCTPCSEGPRACTDCGEVCEIGLTCADAELCFPCWRKNWTWVDDSRSTGEPSFESEPPPLKGPSQHRQAIEATKRKKLLRIVR